LVLGRIGPKGPRKPVARTKPTTHLSFEVPGFQIRPRLLQHPIRPVERADRYHRPWVVGSSAGHRGHLRDRTVLTSILGEHSPAQKRAQRRDRLAMIVRSLSPRRKRNGLRNRGCADRKPTAHHSIVLFFTTMNWPPFLLRLVQAVVPIRLPLRCALFDGADTSVIACGLVACHVSLLVRNDMLVRHSCRDQLLTGAMWQRGSQNRELHRGRWPLRRVHRTFELMRGIHPQCALLVSWGAALSPEQRQQNNNRQRNSKKPKEYTASKCHSNLLICTMK